MAGIGTITNVFVSGVLTDAATLGANLYDPSIATSLELQNGRLDAGNLAPGVELPARKFKPGTFTEAKMVGCTVNRDLFQSVLPGGSNVVRHQSGTIADDPAAFIPLPGGMVEFYLAHARPVLFSWQVNATNDAYCGNVSPAVRADHRCGALRFGIDGTFYGWQRRALRGRAFLANVSAGSNLESADLLSHFDQRWSGHHFITSMSAGWHRAGLFVAGDSLDMYSSGAFSRTDATGPGQTRARTTNIKYIAL
jgi:hypothetical protein